MMNKNINIENCFILLFVNAFHIDLRKQNLCIFCGVGHLTLKLTSESSPGSRPVKVIIFFFIDVENFETV